MDPAAYLRRIGYEGDTAPTRATLQAVQHAHLLAIAYENLDVQLGRRRTPDPAAAFDKLVNGRRGGWCYEMNGTMGLALQAMGFKVTRLASGVMRSAAGDAMVGNHLVLRVDFEDGPLLADVGLAGGAPSPYAIAPGPVHERGREYRLEALDDGWWRFHNHALGMAPNFDFNPGHSDESALAASCVHLQTDPNSMFVQNLLVHRFRPAGEVFLRGRILRELTTAGIEERLLGSADELTDVLGDVFGIDEPAAAGLWPKVLERHKALFPDAP